MSANATNAIPTAAGSSTVASESCTSGQPTCGSPEGTEPTIGSSSESPSTATRAVAPTTAISTPGSLGEISRRPKITARQPAPNASAVGSVSSRPLMNSRTAPMKSSASTEKPNSLGSWETITVRAIPAR